MSEYQYYEFLTVDRPLDERQLGELRALSTRARITPTSLVNTYHWGDFRGGPRKLMERYFDAFLYTSQADLARWVEGLPVSEKNALLLRVAHGDDAHLRMELLRRFREQHRDPSEAAPGSRTVGELLAAAQIRRAEREALEAAQREQERARRERAAATAREKHLNELAADEDHAWQRVIVSLDTKKPTEYDKAVELLVDLRAVAERKNRLDVFERRFAQLRQQHLRKPSLLQRFDRARLTPATAEHEG